MKNSFKLLIAFFLLLFCISIEAQHSNNNFLVEQTPYRQKVATNPNQEAMWDLLLGFSISNLSESFNAGAEWDGTYFYSTKWTSNLIHKYNSTGTALIEQFSIPGVSGLRDLAFDGQYMYGGAAANTIYQMDFNTKTLIGTIPSPVAVRFIAYDENSDAFWCGTWSDPPTLVSRSGQTLASFSTGFAGQYGAAYDNVSAGGPFLYIFDQGAGAGTPQIIHQFDITTGTATGVTHDVTLEFPATAGVAGGLFTMTDWQAGLLTIGGILQGAIDNMFVYDLGLCCPPCPVGAPSNPNPPNGATNVNIIANLNWINGAGTTQIELRFGEAGSMTTVYSGAPITSWAIPSTLNYMTTYQWKVIDKNDTCSTLGPTWSFTTQQNPNLLSDTIIVYPQNVQFWTGTTDNSIKTDGEINTVYPNFGWAVFDISGFPPCTFAIYSVQFYGYVNATNWPYWSATPMGNVNPLTANASDIYNQIMNNSAQGTAYIFSNEASTFSTGWHDYTLEANANNDLLNSLQQDWFAIGFMDRDLVSTYYVNFDGHSQINPPYLVVTYDWTLSCYPPNPPGNLTAQIIYNPGPQVKLNWQDNSYNEIGFYIKRKPGLPNEPGIYLTIGTVSSNTTEYVDATVLPESTYTYKIFAYNPYGSNASNTASITIPIPVELVSFICEVENDAVILNWQTATETNNQGFEIQRLQDYNIEKLQDLPRRQAGWKRIGFVEGNGTTTERKYYSFTDRPDPAKYKYRLKQIDFDGSFEYSTEVEAEISAPLAFSLEQNYPNPFNPNTVIRFQIPGQARNDNVLVTLKVYDVLGREVSTLVNEEKQAGRYEVEFYASSLPSGIYFYRMEAATFVDVRKMIVIK